MAKDESTSFQHGNTGFNICCVPGISDGLTINSLSKMSRACTSSPCQNLVLHLFAWRDSVPYCLTRLETKLDQDLFRCLVWLACKSLNLTHWHFMLLFTGCKTFPVVKLQCICSEHTLMGWNTTIKKKDMSTLPQCFRAELFSDSSNNSV